jgi:hypothetical protein
MATKRRMRAGGWLFLVVGAVLAFGAPVRAQTASAGRMQELAVECSRLRVELDRANGEISALKRSERGLRRDYRLQQRQADAEAIARKLTAAETELRRLRGGPPAPPPPALEAAESPSTLEARADLLSDQARRLAEQAGGLLRAAGELRARQVLLRRAGHIDRDPFAAMDASKRFMVLSAPRQAPGRSGQQPTTPESTTGGPGNGAGSNPGVAPPPPPASIAPTQPTPPTPPGGLSGTSTGSAVPAAGGDAKTTAAGSSNTRALLDPAALPELKRPDGAAGKPLTEIERLERAAAALDGRARALEDQARELRTRAAKR